MAFNGDKEGWNGDGGDEVLWPALKTKASVAALGDEATAAVRVSRAARHGVRNTRVLGALNSPERRARPGLPKRQGRRRRSPARRRRRGGGSTRQRHREAGPRVSEARALGFGAA